VKFVNPVILQVSGPQKELVESVIAARIPANQMKNVAAQHVLHKGIARAVSQDMTLTVQSHLIRKDAKSQWDCAKVSVTLRTRLHGKRSAHSFKILGWETDRTILV